MKRPAGLHLRRRPLLQARPKNQAIRSPTLASHPRQAPVPRVRPASSLWQAALLPLALWACGGAARAQGMGLFTSLPIQWRETQDIRELLAGEPAPHWALAVLRERGEVRPIDSFLPGKGGSPLKGVTMLIMAQPRALAPRENVELDRWVSRGGHVLLFADPMLTAQSRYALGDRRRPEDMVMLSPILARWGLRLEFDEDQPSGERQAEWAGRPFPVALPGAFALVPGSRQCRILAQGLGARCAVGRGRVLAIADAALLDDAAEGGPAERASLLRTLLDEAAARD